MDFLKPPPWLHDLLPPGPARDFTDQGGWLLVLLVGAALVLAVLIALVRQALRRPPAVPDPEAGLREDLAGYPPVSGGPGPRRLLVEGCPARLRLVVLAPAGKEAHIDPASVQPLLEHVLPGLGSVAGHDRPRIRVWPAQLSHQGFAAKFHRLTASPDPDGVPSHWALLAGRARVGGHHLLLGLVVWTEEPTSLGRRTLEPDRWPAVLRVTTPTS
jgi:hypothetical protein